MKTSFTAALLVATSLLTFPALAEVAKPADAPKDAAATPAAPAAPAKDFTIAKIGSEELKNSEVLETWKGLFPGGSAPDFATFDENVRQNVLRGMISEKLIYKEAVKAGTDKSEEVKKRIETLTRQVIMQSYMEGKAKTLVTDDQLKKAYDEKVAAAKGQEELKARHILVASEEEAKKIADQLKKKPDDFEKLAKEKSTDTGSGNNGGDLGWFTKDKMVPEFADAAFKVKKGDISAPVKSAFGWHIIKVEDRRPLKPASFEESKESLRAELTNKAVQSYVEGLLKTADIKYLDASGKEKPFSLSLLPPKTEEAAPAAGKAEEKKPEEKK